MIDKKLWSAFWGREDFVADSTNLRRSDAQLRGYETSERGRTKQSRGDNDFSIASRNDDEIRTLFIFRCT